MGEGPAEEIAGLRLLQQPARFRHFHEDVEEKALPFLDPRSLLTGDEDLDLGEAACLPAVASEHRDRMQAGCLRDFKGAKDVR